MARDIWHELFIDAPIEEVYRAIAEPKGIAAWWTDKVTGAAKEGALLGVGFGEGFIQEMEVSLLKPYARIVWEPTDDGLSDWEGTTIEFKLFRNGGLTYVHLLHANWDDDAEMYAQCNTDWAFYLLSLREYVEHGEGRPFPDDILHHGLRAG